MQDIQSVISQAQLLPHGFVIEIAGVDASKVLNNLTTNEIAKLAVNEHRETFVTDARGWTVAHGFAIKLPERVLFLGQHPEPNRICDHINRYIIREDALVSDISAAYGLCLLSGSVFNEPIANDSLKSAEDWRTISGSITSPDDRLVLVPSDRLKLPAMSPANLTDFELARIRNFWPITGREILDKCIPQELDRDNQTISFTKGCYLGQETIARLDARGKLQKKLCLVEFSSDPEIPSLAAGTELQAGDKVIGSVTSSCWDTKSQKAFALAFLKRGHFDVGSPVSCGRFTGQVLPAPK